MYLTAALLVFLVVGLFWHKRRINQLERRINDLSRSTSERLFLHAKYMGLLSRKDINEELYKPYPDWARLEKERMQWIEDHKYFREIFRRI